MPSSTRRDFLNTLPAAALSLLAARQAFPVAAKMRLAVFTDEITQDFGRAVEIAAREFGLRWVEVRNLWGKHLLELTAAEMGEAKRLLDRYQLQICSIANPLFKTDWPDAPISRESPNKSGKIPADLMKSQDQLLDRGIEVALEFGKPPLRCFDFWRLENPASHRAAMNQTLDKAAQKAGHRGITLMIENEPSCNTASSKEAAEVLASIPNPNFKLLWDPGNSWFAGLDPFPEGYRLLPIARIAHVHCKDAVKNAAGKPEWAAIGRGKINFPGLFAALSRDGYSGALSLETHWHGAGSTEESTRQSMKGLKEALAKAQVAWE